MQTKTKLIIGIIFIAAIGAGVYFSESSSNKGVLIPRTYMRGAVDLLTENLTVTPASPDDTEINVGDGVTFSVTVRNQGTASVQGSTLGFFIGNATTPTILTSTEPLDPNTSVIKSMGWIAAPEGRIQIRACADSGSIIAETNEKNNCTTTTVVITRPPYEGEIGTLSVENAHETANIHQSQIVAGMTNVDFGAYRFSAGAEEAVRITQITVRNTGTNHDGLTAIRMSNNGATFGDSLGAEDGDSAGVTIRYSENNSIPAGGSVLLTVRANTVYSATSGQTAQFIIENIQAEGVSSGRSISVAASGLSAGPVKVLYPTKLNFAWVAQPSTVLTTGTQVEVGRFTIGADAANANNASASVSVSDLRFQYTGTASLTNFTLNSLTMNRNVASNANASNFNATAAGGTLGATYPVRLEQGFTETFRILADVSYNAGSQTVQFRFNSGSFTSTGTATWGVTNNSRTVGSAWTVLAGDAESVTSSTLQRR